MSVAAQLILERRIASALVDDTSASTDIAALILEMEEAVTAADRAAEAQRANALDLTASPDADKAREAMLAAEFRAQRMRNALPRLRQRLTQVEKQEYTARWVSDYEQVRKGRDELAAEFNQQYPSLVAKLVDLLRRVEDCDREVSRINGSAPSGDYRRLLGVELIARGIEGFTVSTGPAIAPAMRLPSLPNSAVMAWPGPKRSWQSRYIHQMAVASHPGASWHEQAEERARALGEGSQRALAHAAEMTRQREERENEVVRRRALEASQAARRPAGWPG